MEQNQIKEKTYFGLSKNVIFLGAVSFLNDASSDMIYPFIPIFLTSVLGASVTFVGLIEGIANATASFLKLFSGYVSDKMRQRKSFVVCGYGLSAITKPVLALAAVPWHVLLVRFFDRAGKGLRDAPRDALISFSTEKKDVGRAFGFHRTADTFGAALGPLLAFLLLPLLHNNLRTLFLLSFVASFLAVLILWIFVKEVKDHNPQLSLPRFDFRNLGTPFIIFLAAATIFSLGSTSEFFLLLRAQKAGLAIRLLPIIYFVYNIIYAVFSTPAGILSDKIGHRNTFMIGMIIFSGTYFLFSFNVSLPAIWLLFIIYGFYSAFTDGVGRAIIADLVQEEWRATAYGIYNAFTGFALLPASLVFGFLWDRFGYAFAFQYGAVLGITALFIFFFLRIRNREKVFAV